MEYFNSTVILLVGCLVHNFIALWGVSCLVSLVYTFWFVSHHPKLTSQMLYLCPNPAFCLMAWRGWGLWLQRNTPTCMNVSLFTSVSTFVMTSWSQLLVSSLTEYNKMFILKIIVPIRVQKEHKAVRITEINSLASPAEWVIVAPNSLSVFPHRKCCLAELQWGKRKTQKAVIK